MQFMGKWMSYKQNIQIQKGKNIIVVRINIFILDQK